MSNTYRVNYKPVGWVSEYGTAWLDGRYIEAENRIDAILKFVAFMFLLGEKINIDNTVFYVRKWLEDEEYIIGEAKEDE